MANTYPLIFHFKTSVGIKTVEAQTHDQAKAFIQKYQHEQYPILLKQEPNPNYWKTLKKDAIDSIPKN